MVYIGMELIGIVWRIQGCCSDDIQTKLCGVDCVLAYETASDYLGTNAGTHQRPAFYVYSLKELNIDGVECIVVDSYDNLEVVYERGMYCTSVTQTLIDLLRNDRDDQVIVESMADWYFSHNESFDGLEIPEDIRELFESYIEDAVDYYSY